MSDNQNVTQSAQPKVQLPGTIQGQPVANPPKAATPEPATAAEAAPEKTPKARKAAPVRRAKEKDLSWTEAEAVISFYDRFKDSTLEHQGKVLLVFGLEQSGDASTDALNLAQALRPSGGKIWAYETYTKLARSVKGGSFGFAEIIALINELTNSDANEVKLFDNAINAFGIETDYKRNMAITDYVQQVHGAVEASKESVNLGLFEWIDTQLEIWPGEF